MTIENSHNFTPSSGVVKKNLCDLGVGFVPVFVLSIKNEQVYGFRLQLLDVNLKKSERNYQHIAKLGTFNLSGNLKRPRVSSKSS